MNKNCYVVTKADEGWDCVIGVYFANSEEEVDLALTKSYGLDLSQEEATTWMEENYYIVHSTISQEL